MLEAIHWKPAIRWVIDRIHVLTPIATRTIHRNEVGRKAPAGTIRAAMNRGDIDLLWEALCHMFERDRSAARMEMNPQDLIVFRHDSAFGNALAQKLFRRVKVERNGDVKVPRSFDDYAVTVDEADLPAGVTVLRPSA